MSALTRYEDYDEGPQSLRLWLSDRQWMALLTRIERDASAYDGANRRREDRPRYPAKLHCAVRVQEASGRSGTYIVRGHNISAGGLGFVHTQELPRGSRCTVALQAQDGQGLISAGRIAWVRRIDDADVEAFEVGVEFSQPIDPGPFTGSDALPAA